MGILEHHAQGAAQVILLDGLDVDTAIGDDAVLDLVKAVDQIGDGGLARAGGAHKGDLLPGVCKDGHVVEDLLARHIGEVHMLEAHRPGELGQHIALLPLYIAADAVEPEGRIVLIDVFPRPQVAGHVLPTLHQFVMRILACADQNKAGILRHLPGPVMDMGALGRGRHPALAVPDHGDQGHKALVGLRGLVHTLLKGEAHAAVIGFRLVVHYIENALGARQGGENGGELLRDLIHGLAHLPAIIEVEGEGAQRQTHGDGQHPAEGGGQGIADVHDVHGDGHDGGGVKVGRGGGGAVILIEPCKERLGLLLVGEGLDHLQPFNGLLDISVDGAQVGLLLLIIPPAAAAEDLEHHEGAPQSDHGHQEKQWAHHQHHHHDAHKHEYAGEEGDHALFQGELHIVRVVGEAAHELSMGMAVKVG